MQATFTPRLVAICCNIQAPSSPILPNGNDLPVSPTTSINHVNSLSLIAQGSSISTNVRIGTVKYNLNGPAGPA